MATGLSVAALAGCTGSNREEIDYDVVAEPPAGLVYTDIETSTDESDSLGEVFVITGTLENTGSQELEIPLIIGVAYTADNVRLGEATNGVQPGQLIGPGERVRFTIEITAETNDVGRFSLEFRGEDGPATTPTATPAEAATPAPQSGSESFYDGFESGDIRTSTAWGLTLLDKRATQRVEADAVIIEQTGPDGGTGSLSFRVENGGRATATTSEPYRWDVPFRVEGAFNLDVRMNRFSYTRIGLFGGEVFLDMDIPNTAVGIDSRNERAEFVRTDIGEWQNGTWYLYDCDYDGDGRYSLTVWQESVTRPTRPTAVTSGEPLTDTPLPLVITNYAGGDITVNHAFIRYTAGDALP